MQALMVLLLVACTLIFATPQQLVGREAFGTELLTINAVTGRAETLFPLPTRLLQPSAGMVGTSSNRVVAWVTTGAVNQQQLYLYSVNLHTKKSVALLGPFGNSQLISTSYDPTINTLYALITNATLGTYVTTIKLSPNTASLKAAKVSSNKIPKGSTFSSMVVSTGKKPVMYLSVQTFNYSSNRYQPYMAIYSPSGNVVRKVLPLSTAKKGAVFNKFVAYVGNTLYGLLTQEDPSSKGNYFSFLVKVHKYRGGIVMVSKAPLSSVFAAVVNTGTVSSSAFYQIFISSRGLQTETECALLYPGVSPRGRVPGHCPIGGSVKSPSISTEAMHAASSDMQSMKEFNAPRSTEVSSEESAISSIESTATPVVDSPYALIKFGFDGSISRTNLRKEIWELVWLPAANENTTSEPPETTQVPSDGATTEPKSTDARTSPTANESGRLPAGSCGVGTTVIHILYGLIIDLVLLSAGFAFLLWRRRKRRIEYRGSADVDRLTFHERVQWE